MPCISSQKTKIRILSLALKKEIVIFVFPASSPLSHPRHKTNRNEYEIQRRKSPSMSQKHNTRPRTTKILRQLWGERQLQRRPQSPRACSAVKDIVYHIEKQEQN